MIIPIKIRLTKLKTKRSSEELIVEGFTYGTPKVGSTLRVKVSKVSTFETSIITKIINDDIFMDLNSSYKIEII